MGRKSEHGHPPGIHEDQHGQLWATLEGDDAKRWRERYPGRGRPPRRKAKDIREAIKLHRQLVRDIETGRDPRADNPTIALLVERWIDGRVRIAESTRRRYRQSLTWQIKPLRIGRLRLQQLTREHVQSWVHELCKLPRQSDPDQLLDPYSIRNAFAVLRGALNEAVRSHAITYSPCSGIELPDPDDEEIHPLTPAQINTFLKLVDNYHKGRPHRLAALYHLAIFCGLRQGELIGLRWADVDLERRELRVTGQIQRGKRQRGKTRKAHRTIPLTSRMVSILQIHRANQHQERSVSHAEWNAAELLFCSGEGTPVDGNNLYRQYITLLRQVGLTEPCRTCRATGTHKNAECPTCHGHTSIALFRFHDLRHTYAALGIAAGVDIATLSRRMGHESINTTADKYGHLYRGHADDAQAIERLLKREADHAEQ